MIWQEKDQSYYATQCFKGMSKAFPDAWQIFSSSENSAALIKKKLSLDQVAIVVSGGAGNGPLFPSYVGQGLADAAVVGAPFAAPNAYTLYEVGKYLGREQGVLLLYNNFAGDFLNNDMAAELLAMDGIAVESIIVHDDLATALGENREKRGGRCGIVPLIKLAGSCASRGMSLKNIANLLRKANERIATISLMLDKEQLAVTFGAGFSGEPGIRTIPNNGSTEAVKIALDLLLEDLQPTHSERLFVLVNRLRLTSYADSYIMANVAYDYLKSHEHAYEVLMRVGAYSNISDHYGLTLTIMCMDDLICHLMDTRISTDSFIL